MNNRLSSTAKQRRAAAAFTLAEVMVAVPVLAIMMISVFGGITFGLGNIRTSLDDLRATQILTQKMESIRLLTWNQLSNCPPSFVDYYAPSQAATNRGTLYNGAISVGTATNIPNWVSYKGQVRLVTVSVSWTNLIGSKTLIHNRQMQTLYALNGMQNYLWGNHP